ncbi:helix-turn-helix transcriptional regulator [Streptomyces radicis]|uniref:LuxR family transcriptional regulator n=1 Tax=Streptomyces radicis TaxID=1750517 RepID=A0A3A9WI44_9ACTN|nr:LuxR family transcriptional regulator [Streptomyces radicis]RKN07376.1 LuxR family transcriptional regulator [Streptomyces radicis]RKN19605.1 LuxR family transcriptional regulator [Streptomyces radicis]
MRLLERGDHLVRLGLLLDDSIRGEGRTVLLNGPAGSGKTELLRNFAEAATKSDVLFLDAICSPAERKIPFSVLSQLFRSAPLPPGLVARAGQLIDRALTTTAPATSPYEELTFEAVQVIHGLSQVILDLAAETPLLIGIDDIRNADGPSWCCLHYLARRISSARILLVLAGEDHPEPENSPLRAELLRLPNVAELHVGLLGQDAVTGLLTDELGARAAHRLAPALHAASGGNPLLLHALVEDHREAAGVRAEGYGRAVLRCAHRAGPEPVRIARALAVLGEPAQPAALGDLADTTPATVERALRTLTAAGLLDGGDFRHPAARAAVLDDLPTTERAAYSRRAAELLHRQGADPVAVARHLVDAGDAAPLWARDLLLEAAEHALLDGRVPWAVECLELAHRGCQDGPERAVIRARLADAEWQLNPLAAAHHLGPLVADLRAGRLAPRHGVPLIRQLLWLGRVTEATEALEHLRALPAPEAAGLRDLEAWLAVVHPPLAPHRPRTAAPGGPEDGLTGPHDDVRLRSLAVLSDLLTRGRREETAEQAEQTLSDLSLGRPDPWAVEAALLALQVLVQAGRYRAAERWCDDLAEAATRRTPVWRAVFAAVRAETALRRGELAEAMAAARAALTHLPPGAWGLAVGFPLATLIMAATRAGDHDEGARLLAHPVPFELNAGRHGLHYLHARGHYYLATHHPHAALADFMSCGELMRGWGLDLPDLVPWRTSAAEAWLRLGNKDRARRLASDQLARPGTDGTAARASSLRILATSGPAARWPQLLTEALDIFEDHGNRLEQAHTLADLSRAHYALGEKRRARMVFRRAWHLAKLCRARPLTEELLSVPSGLSGAVAEPEERAELSRLTDSERRVASLAVMGYTNREIAGKLFITASTVEQHLTRVYRKLDVKRRQELPVHLGTGAPGGAEHGGNAA